MYQREKNIIQERLIIWRDRPDIFAEEIFGVTLEKWQQDFLMALPLEERIAGKSGHGVGKSMVMSIVIPWYLSTRTPAKIMATSPTAHQLFDILWAELSLWLRKAKYNFGSLFRLTEDSIYLLEAPKENFATARTARRDQPEALQGGHSKNMMFLIDEASGIPENIFETAEGSMSTKGSKTIMFSNPTRTSGYFFDAFNKNRSRWKTFSISCFDSSHVDKSYITNMQKYGLESNIYKVRVLGEFPFSNDDCVIGLNYLEDSVDRGIGAFGEIVWGVDVARFGDNRTALAKRQGSKLLEPVQSWNQRDTMQTAGLIKKQYDDITDPKLKPEKIVVDVIGLGSGVVDRLKELGLPVIGVNVAEVPAESEKYMRLRDELWFMGREWFMSKNCDIPDDQVLISELSGPKYFITSAGKMRVETKDEMKKRSLESPDVADAFILTFCKEKPRVRVKTSAIIDRPTSWLI